MKELHIKLLWQSDDTYCLHRIPGILVTAKSTVLVYHEARREESDWAHMDILLQRSEDGGRTFGDPIALAGGNDTYKTVNNPVMIEDRNGRLHLLYCRDYTVRGGGAWHRFSDDDGKTWSRPDEVTAATLPDFHNVFAFGPGHGICLSDGTLLVPVWMVPKSAGVELEKHGPSVISTFYSKDDGKTWQTGEILPAVPSVPSPNETAAAQLPDGGVLLNIRSRTRYRSLSYSKSGVSGWEPPAPVPELPDPKCFGSMIATTALFGEPTLLAVNCESHTVRACVVLRGSVDGGRTWPLRRTLDAERGGYCDIAADEKHDRVYVLYEDNWGREVYLATLTADWIR